MRQHAASQRRCSAWRTWPLCSGANGGYSGAGSQHKEPAAAERRDGGGRSRGARNGHFNTETWPRALC